MADKQRISVKYKTPNPLFEKWLTEWYDKAKEHDSKMKFTFSNALKSLKKYPLPLETGKDCIILKGFGNKLCDMLDKKLKEHKENTPQQQNTAHDSPKRQTPKKAEPKTPARKNNTTRPYKPAKDTGPYAILLGLLKKSQELNNSGSFTKAEIVEHARHLCDKSFIKPDPGSFYTAWSSMATLVTKGLVLKNGNPAKFKLSDTGEQLAIELFQEMEDAEPEHLNIAENINNTINKAKSNNASSSQSHDSSLIRRIDNLLGINNQTPIPSTSKATPNIETISQDNEESSQASSNPPTRKNNTTRPYKPAKDTGPYAILLGLLKKSQELNNSGSFTKAEIVEHAKSFIKPDPGSFNTAWSSMGTLVTKGLVLKNGNPAKFKLSDTGEQLAIELFQEMEAVEPEHLNIAENINNAINNAKSNNASSSQSHDSSLIRRIDNLLGIDNQTSIPSTSKATPNIETNSQENEESSQASSNPPTPARNNNTTRPYKPAKDTGPYAILLGLLKKSQELNNSGSFTKAEIVEHAKSFIKPDPGSFNTAWSSMGTLVTKGLVLKNGNPAKYKLSDTGEQLAIELFQEMEDVEPEHLNIAENINNAITNVRSNNASSSQSHYLRRIDNLLGIDDQTSIPSTSKATPNIETNSQENEESSQASSNPTTETVIFQPGKFDIILLVDNHETTGGVKDPSNDESLLELNKYKIKYEVRHLKIGDFTWICREKDTNEELILPYIAERKRMDDLGHSIKDGRFHEQKFRLKNCGIQNLIYIIESYGNNTRTCLPLSSLLQAATNTLIQDDFQVKFTDNQRHSMQYLAGVTLSLATVYQQKTLMSCTKEYLDNANIMQDFTPLMIFKDFNKGASKTKKFTVKEIFTRQLLQLNGVSVDKALAIANKYPTPKLLKMAYDSLDPVQGEKLLASIRFGPLKKSIGPVISKTIYQLYTLNTLN